MSSSAVNVGEFESGVVGQFESFLMLVTGTFSAPHSAQTLLIAPVGRASSGFVTKSFQHLREIHFLTPEVFAVP